MLVRQVDVGPGRVVAEIAVAVDVVDAGPDRVAAEIANTVSGNGTKGCAEERGLFVYWAIALKIPVSTVSPCFIWTTMR